MSQSKQAEMWGYWLTKLWQDLNTENTAEIRSKHVQKERAASKSLTNFWLQNLVFGTRTGSKSTRNVSHIALACMDFTVQ